MSKPKDPKDVAIAYVMQQPLEQALQFVQMLGSIVKARATVAPAKKEAAAAPAPRKSTRAAPPAVSSPSADAAPATTAALPISSAAAQPS